MEEIIEAEKAEEESVEVLSGGGYPSESEFEEGSAASQVFPSSESGSEDEASDDSVEVVEPPEKKRPSKGGGGGSQAAKKRLKKAAQESSVGSVDSNDDSSVVVSKRPAKGVNGAKTSKQAAGKGRGGGGALQGGGGSTTTKGTGKGTKDEGSRGRASSKKGAEPEQVTVAVKKVDRGDDYLELPSVETCVPSGSLLSGPFKIEITSLGTTENGNGGIQRTLIMKGRDCMSQDTDNVVRVTCNSDRMGKQLLGTGFRAGGVVVVSSVYVHLHRNRNSSKPKVTLALTLKTTLTLLSQLSRKGTRRPSTRSSASFASLLLLLVAELSTCSVVSW